MKKNFRPQVEALETHIALSTVDPLMVMPPQPEELDPMIVEAMLQPPNMINLLNEMQKQAEVLTEEQEKLIREALSPMPVAPSPVTTPPPSYENTDHYRYFFP